MTERYSRQILFPPIGAEGQRRLSSSSAVLVGCGAIGASVADMLVRAGVGRLRLVDRDFVEESNLQRQTLFEEEDARQGYPKAEAARRRLARVNAQVLLEARVEDLHPGNASSLLEGFDLLLDGTDNFATRYLLNDFAIERDVPWVYAGAVGSSGLALAVLPGETACLRCVFPEPPPEGSTPTCDTSGVIAPAIGIVASLEVAAALQILTGNRGAVSRELRHFDAWEGTFRAIRPDRRPDCPACGERRLEFLRGERGGSAAALCGRDAVRVFPKSLASLDLAAVESRLRAGTRILSRNPWLLRFLADGREIALFPDGRAIVKGTQDPAQARALYSRFVGD